MTVQFADDTLIFMDGEQRYNHMLNPMLEIVFGLKINWSNSHLLG